MRTGVKRENYKLHIINIEFSSQGFYNKIRFMRCFYQGPLLEFCRSFLTVYKKQYKQKDVYNSQTLMTSFEKEIELSNNIKQNYECDVIISETRPYTLYCGADIGKILGISNIRGVLSGYNKINILKKTKGGHQNVTYIDYDSLIKLITKSRKPMAIEVSEKLNIKTITKYYVSIETDVIKCLLTAFDGNVMTPQYKVDNYFIDLYFDEYLLAIECDENHHNSDTNKFKDAERQQHIMRKTGCRFIRFNPSDTKFNIFGLINDIYIHLSVFPRKLSENK